MTAGLRLAERGLNRCLNYDAYTAERVSALNGKILAIDLVGPDLVIYVFAQSDGLKLSDSCETPADVYLRGTPVDLAAAFGRGGEHRWTAGGAVEIRGELALVQELQSILADTDVDWEEMLSQVTGDVLAHQLGNAARAFRLWLADTRASLELDVSEYLKYEKRLVPAPGELERFDDEVASLRDDVERLEQRIVRLGRILQSPR